MEPSSLTVQVVGPTVAVQVPKLDTRVSIAAIAGCDPAHGPVFGLDPRSDVQVSLERAIIAAEGDVRAPVAVNIGEYDVLTGEDDAFVVPDPLSISCAASVAVVSNNCVNWTESGHIDRRGREGGK